MRKVRPEKKTSPADEAMLDALIDEIPRLSPVARRRGERLVCQSAGRLFRPPFRRRLIARAPFRRETIAQFRLTPFPCVRRELELRHRASPGRERPAGGSAHAPPRRPLTPEPPSP